MDVMVLPVEEGASSMDPVANYLKDGSLQDAGTEAHKLKIKVSWFCFINGQLYQKSYQGSYLLCIGPTDAERIMTVVHDGDCDNHSGGRLVVHKILNARLLLVYHA